MAAFFSAFGQVLEFKIVIDPVTGVSRGYGFVAFVHTASADCLKAMRSIDFFGKTVRAPAPRVAAQRVGHALTRALSLAPSLPPAERGGGAQGRLPPRQRRQPHGLARAGGRVHRRGLHRHAAAAV